MGGSYGDSLGTIINLRLSFIETIALRVTKLSPMPAANLPKVVPLHGTITIASIFAEPLADFAAYLRYLRE